MKKEYYVYIYKDKRTGKFIYVGGTIGERGKSLKRRINEKKRNIRFLPYLPHVEILLWEVTNEYEVEGIKLLLINEYKPTLNIKYKHEGKATFPLRLPERFMTYQEYLEKNAE